MHGDENRFRLDPLEICRIEPWDYAKLGNFRRGRCLLSIMNDEKSENKAYEAYLCKDKEFNKPATVFSSSNKIYLILKCFELKKGKYTFNALWYTPSGELQEAARHAFSLAKKSSYTLWSWMLLENDMPGQSFSLSEYDAENNRTWSVELYLNDEKITELKFKMLD